MKGCIDGFNWVEVEPMKYWTFTSTMSALIRRETVNNAIYSGDYIGARKVDGYYQRVVKDDEGNCFMIARSRNVNNEVVDKIEWVPQINPWFESLPNGTCVLCECYLPGNEGSKNITSILGCLKDKAIARQKETPLHLYVFDVMAYNGQNFNKTKFEDRVKYLSVLNKTCNSEYVSYAVYYEGAELYKQLQSYLADGLEGIVIMRKDAIVYNKRTPARVSIKVKKELQDTLDVVIIGANSPTRLYGGKEIESWMYWEDLRTGEKFNEQRYKDYANGMSIEPITKAYYHGWAGSLRIGFYNGKDYTYIGSISGLTEEVLMNWKKYILKVAEVSGMEIFKDENGKFSGIRHPKFMGWRVDKLAKECTFDQVK